MSDHKELKDQELEAIVGGALVAQSGAAPSEVTELEQGTGNQGPKISDVRPF